MEFGGTPFDNLTREQLLLLVLKYDEALSGLYSVAEYWKGISFPIQPYWSIEGRGGLALAVADEIRAISCKTPAQRSRFFYKFLRYAGRMLFDVEHYTSIPWQKCDKCDSLTAIIKAGDGESKCLCGGNLSLYMMKDLRPDLDVKIS
tara:strand:+ start:16874 stop:17314 length:441 start_codon:yes stop_codon:yes gene_type:complete